MKNFKILFSVAVASALVACSSMDVDDDEALAGNFPSGFSFAEYAEIHPQLVRIQVRDYVTDYNAKLADAAKALGPEEQAAFDARKAADIEAFAALDTSVLHSILVDRFLGGYTEADWTEDWSGGEAWVKTAETRLDTLSLAFDTPEGVVKVVLKQNKGDETGSITYDENGKITAVSGFEKCPTTGCVDPKEVIVGEDWTLAQKNVKTALDTISIDSVLVPTEGAISAEHMKVLNRLNFYDNASNDLDSLLAVVARVDTFAVSYQYVMYGKSHGWAYRKCNDDEMENPRYDGEYPATKLYCADGNGFAREAKESK